MRYFYYWIFLFETIEIQIVSSQNSSVWGKFIMPSERVSFHATYNSSEKIVLTWRETSSSNYVIDYTCKNDLCSDNFKGNKETNLTRLEIPNIPYFSNCLFELAASINGRVFQETASLNNVSRKIDAAELPKYVNITHDSIYIYLEDCAKFGGPLTYQILYKPKSTENGIKQQEQLYLLDRYKNPIVIKTAESQPRTSEILSYNMLVVATRGHYKTKIRFINVLLFPDKYMAVENCSAYSGNTNNTISVQWQVSNSLNEIKLYNATLPCNKTEFIQASETWPCELSKDFICANIPHEGNENFHITLQAQSMTTLRWGNSNTFFITSKAESDAPRNLQHQVSPNSSIIISWDHPLYIYGTLKQFLIKIEGEQEYNIPLNVTRYQPTYTKEISVSLCKNCIITVSVKNEFASQNVSKHVKTHEKEMSTTTTTTQETPYLKHIIVLATTTICCLGVVIAFFIYRSCRPWMKSMLCSTPQDENTIISNLEQLVENRVLHVLAPTSTSAVSLRSKVRETSINIGSPLQNALKMREMDNSAETEPSIFEENAFSNSLNIELLENYLLTLADADCDALSEKYKKIPKTKTVEHSYNKICHDFYQNSGSKRAQVFYPYDDTKVILKENEENCINAHYIDGYKRSEEAFIATNAPLPSMIQDFWSMVIQERTDTIIMLTDNRIKCQTYWPQHQGNCRIGNYFITNIKERFNSYSVHRELLVQLKNNDPHLVQHFQFTAWPNDGVPLDVKEFLDFLKTTVDPKPNSHIIVHGNAGCASFAGTFILCDLALRMAMHEKSVNFLNLLKNIRNQRLGMVSTLQEYTFAHLVVWYNFFGHNFSIPITETFETNVQKAFDECYIDALGKYLKMHKLLYKDVSTNSASDSEERIPGSSSQTEDYSKLHELHALHPTCVQWTGLNCFKNFPKFLIVRQTESNTVDDFWSFVIKLKIDTIIRLNKHEDDSGYLSSGLWPQACRPVWSLSKTKKICLIKEDDSDVAFKEITLDVTQKSTHYMTEINVIHLKRWDGDKVRPENLEDLIHAWMKIKQIGQNVLVTCNDGVTASGLFATLALLLEKMNESGFCDVFWAISTMRQNNLQFVRYEEQVAILYEAALVYARNFLVQL